MSMISKTKSKNEVLKKNVTKAAFIQFKLKQHGYTQKQIADDLGIKPQAISRSIHGLSTISRVNCWLKENIGMEL